MFWQRLALPATPSISPAEVQRRLQNGERLNVIDVREPHEFARGHIPGARLLPLGQLQAHVDSLDPRAEYIVVCRSGRRSAIACRLLAQRGFTRARNMTGGMLAWRGPTV